MSAYLLDVALELQQRDRTEAYLRETRGPGAVDLREGIPMPSYTAPALAAADRADTAAEAALHHAGQDGAPEALTASAEAAAAATEARAAAEAAVAAEDLDPEAAAVHLAEAKAAADRAEEAAEEARAAADAFRVDPPEPADDVDIEALAQALYLSGAARVAAEDALRFADRDDVTLCVQAVELVERITGIANVTVPDLREALPLALELEDADHAEEAAA